MSAVGFWSWWADDYLKRSESILWSSKIASSVLELIHSAFPSQEWAKGFASYFQGAFGLTSVYRFVPRITPVRRAYEQLRVSRAEGLKFIQESAFLGASLFFTLSSMTRDKTWRYRAAALSLVSGGIELFEEQKALRRFHATAELANQRLKVYKVAAGILSSLLFIMGAPEWAIAVASLANAVFALYGSYHKDVLSPKPPARLLSPVVPTPSPASATKEFGAQFPEPPPAPLPDATTLS